MYAVGYRAEKDSLGNIKKYYRDWDGTLHLIFPDPFSSTSIFTYWFFCRGRWNKKNILMENEPTYGLNWLWKLIGLKLIKR